MKKIIVTKKIATEKNTFWINVAETLEKNGFISTKNGSIQVTEEKYNSVEEGSPVEGICVSNEKYTFLKDGIYVESSLYKCSVL